ncbi:hypothetical protein DOTSEDRAFT_42757 [Dothistroma septosporum NZE10]|uniref:Uncharacterized protein n=1 Tax=Dothistroma septosporum (strain NZE10 / CBS 128990) TaxID=675120 RepID=N1PUY2_DOTSN|nr:hypothetical protein DOTSEDRAFT_42757 [Dothistroma septosporum NZE10]
MFHYLTDPVFRAHLRESSCHRTSADLVTDPTIREILDGYDYTRFNPYEEPSSPPLERGLGVVLEASDEDDASGFGPGMSWSTARYATEHGPKNTPQPAEFPASYLPTPPAPAYVGPRYYSGYSELPTSEQTYGETNQLLQITPEVVQYAPYSLGEKHYEAPFARRYADYYAATSMPLKHDRPRADSDSSKPILSTYKPTLSNDKENIPPEGSDDPRGGDAADVEELLKGDQIFRFFDPGPNDASQRCAYRASSHYADDAESGWESEFSDSINGLPRALSQHSMASYADTSIAGSQHRSSIENGIPGIEKRDTIMEEVPHDGPPKIGIGLSKTFTKSFPPDLDSQLAKKATGFGTTKYPGIDDDARSDKDVLLGNAPRTPRPGELAYSPSVDTMTTVREHVPKADDGPPKRWPHFGRSHSSGVVGTAKQGQVITLEPKRSQRVVLGQHELKELQLVKPKARDRPRRGWTDAQYLARARGWADDQGLGPRPYMTANSPLAKYTDPRSSSFDAKISSKRLLVDPKLEDYCPPVLYEERKAISKEFLKWIAAFPPLTLAYGLGYFDGYMHRKTNGRIAKMAPNQKYEALYVYTPLSSLLWAIAGVVAAILIMGFASGSITSGGNSAPF